MHIHYGFLEAYLYNVTGNRYFDFELYQTDIYYDLTSQKWYGYGPDEGQHQLRSLVQPEI